MGIRQLLRSRGVTTLVMTKLWLAINERFESLDVCEAETEEQAFYTFMRQSIYPYKVIALPSNVNTVYWDDE